MRQFSRFTLLGIVVVTLLTAGEANTQFRDLREETELSGTFHLFQKEPAKRLAFPGKTGILKIKNIGPAGLVVRNSSNNVTLGADTEFDSAFEGETVLSVSVSGADCQTDGTFEVLIKKK